MKSKKAKEFFTDSASTACDTPKCVKETFTIINDKGLHTRPSTELVKCASSFKSQITLYYQNMSVNAKSLLDILMLAAGRGAKITIEAVGEDAEEAVKAILDLAQNKFYIKY
jgi:phosphocarrier protein